MCIIIVLLHIHFLKMMDYCQICQCFALPTLFYKVFSILNSVLLFVGAIICLLIMNYLVAEIKDHGILPGALLNHK